MSGMRWLGRKIGMVLWAAILGLGIALIPQGLWSALVVANLRTGAVIPWSVPLIAILLWLHQLGSGHFEAGVFLCDVAKEPRFDTGPFRNVRKN